MIVTSASHPYKIDVGRPSFTTDDQRLFYKQFFDLIETSSYPIIVNGVYPWMREMVEQGKSYLGGGFSFCFWFATKEDRQQFIKDAAKLEMIIEDWHNLSFYFDQDKVMHVLFAPHQYLSEAQSFIETHPALSMQPHRSPGYNGELIETGRMIVDGPLKELVELKAHLLEVWLDLE